MCLSQGFQNFLHKWYPDRVDRAKVGCGLEGPGELHAGSALEEQLKLKEGWAVVVPLLLVQRVSWEDNEYKLECLGPLYTQGALLEPLKLEWVKPGCPRVPW